MANIKCGHCTGYHDSVAQVRLCAQRHDHKWASTRPTPAAAPVRELRPVKPTEQRREADRRQLLSDIRAAGERVSEGRYALRNATRGGNDISFYRVTKGRNGSTFVRQIVSEEEHNLSWERQLAALLRIAANPEEAMALFGRETVRCGHCNRRLTNDESRARGIGPVCATKMGWAA